MSVDFLTPTDIEGKNKAKLGVKGGDRECKTCPHPA